jgi:hydroxymethylbilane synthase
LGLEFAENRPDLAQLLAFMEHAPSRACVTAERAFLAALDGGCQTPIGALARPAPKTPEREIILEGLVADLRGERIVRVKQAGAFDNPAKLGQRSAERLLKAGAAEIMDRLRAALAEHAAGAGRAPDQLNRR